jgi:hypothetical protein
LQLAFDITYIYMSDYIIHIHTHTPGLRSDPQRRKRRRKAAAPSSREGREEERRKEEKKKGGCSIL